jgi:hypothetical protein
MGICGVINWRLVAGGVAVVRHTERRCGFVIEAADPSSLIALSSRFPTRERLDV